MGPFLCREGDSRVFDLNLIFNFAQLTRYGVALENAARERNFRQYAGKIALSPTKGGFLFAPHVSLLSLAGRTCVNKNEIPPRIYRFAFPSRGDPVAPRRKGIQKNQSPYRIKLEDRRRREATLKPIVRLWWPGSPF